MERKTTPYRIESVVRALKILQLITERGSISVTEAAQALGVNPSTTSRLLDTIAAEGFATKNEQRRYVAGPNLLRPGRDAGPVPVADRLRPYLTQLFAETEETVQISALIGTEVSHVDHIEAHDHNLVYTSPINRRFPAHATATGRCMLARLSWDEVMELYADATSDELPNFTRLRAQLAKVRERGYAINREGAEQGVIAMATCLGRVDGTLFAVYVGIPKVRFTAATEEAVAQALIALNGELTPGLG